MGVSVVVWSTTVAILVVILALDVALIAKRPHEPSMRECGIFIGVYVGLAIAFGLAVWAFTGTQYAAQFFAGWLTEYSLSVDNLFVFIIIMQKLKVPRPLQQFALMIGIILALVFRGIFIAAGAAAIQHFSWVFFIFGAFLLYTAIKLAKDYFEGDDDEELSANPLMKAVHKHFPATDHYAGTKLTVVEDGRRMITPMLFVIVALGSTDLIFAFDSIPAIYGLTQEPYLVFAATVFALMGLRQLYFLIGGLLTRLVYLSLGLSVILFFIGVKLILHALHEYHLDERLGFNGEVPIWASLVMIIATLLVTTVASLLETRHDTQERTSGD